jgi:CBS domain containing-hemolysin-like protein
MSSALAIWWGNPITAVFLSLVLLLPLAFTVAGLMAVVRLGNIQLGGLLAQRTGLLPGYPRRSDAYATLIVFLQIMTGVLLVLFSLAVVRAGRLIAASNMGLLAVLFLGWLVVIVVGVGIARGPRVEPMTLVALVALRPWTPLLRRLAFLEGPEEEPKPGEEEEAVDEHEVQAFIGAGEDAGILEREDAELVASIVELSETVAREIVTPRTDVVALSVNADFATVKRVFAESMFTRVPVFRDTLDRIEGVVHVKDVLRSVAGGSTPTVGSSRVRYSWCRRQALRELLREFQSARQQLAVVVDEYGGTSGIVTLEDVLEEIVGEISDEHQRPVPEIQKESEGVYLLDGAAHVGVLDELFGVEVGEVAFDSVAGLVLDRLGHLPRIGEHASWQGLDLEVVEVDRRRLRRVRARRSP